MKQSLILISFLVLCFCVTPIVAETTGSADNVESVVNVSMNKNDNDYPFSFIGTVIVALIGVVGGILGSFGAPWVNWWVEKRRLKHNRKVELIKEWRAFIENFDFYNQNFGNTTVYGAMRPFMDDEAIKRFEAQRVIHIPPDGGRGDQLSKQWASDQVAMIEGKWNLI